MDRRSIALALILATSCAATARNLILRQPDYVTSTNIRVYFNGLDAGVSNNTIDYVVTHTLAECLGVCDGATNGIAENFIISWMPPNFECITRKVSGCDYNSTIYVSSINVIPDEIGHVCFQNCGIESEIELPDGGPLYTNEFQKFINAVNQ